MAERNYDLKKKVKCLKCGKELPYETKRCSRCGICIEC